MNRLVIAISVVLCASLLSACGGGGTPAATTAPPAPAVKKKVVVTNSILGDFVSVIAGTGVDLTVLAPQNADPRSYVLSSADVTSTTNADLLIENGIGLEPWFDNFIKTADLRGSVVKATNGITTRVDETGAPDPFVWVSPSNGRVMVSNVRQALSALLPDSKALFESNERAYAASLDSVISYARQATSLVRNNRLVYIGEPLGYFCDEFEMACTAVNATEISKRNPSTAEITKVLNAVKAIPDPAAIVVAKDVPQSVVNNLKVVHPTARVTSGDDALSVESIGDASGRHPDYIALERDVADLLSAQLR